MFIAIKYVPPWIEILCLLQVLSLDNVPHVIRDDFIPQLSIV